MRVFTGLPLPAQAIEKLQKLTVELKERYPDLRVVKPQGMHITMVFFGELDQDQVMEVMRIMDNSTLKIATVQAVMSGIGQFPPQGKPRVLYCPLRKGAPEVSSLYRSFTELLLRNDSFAIEVTKDFTPHVTLARNREARIRLSDFEELFDFEYSFILDKLVLYQSLLKPQGAEYRAMKTVTFG